MYTRIATEKVQILDRTAAGSKELWDFEIHELGGVAATDPIGIEGSPVMISGSRQNDILYPFNPIQIQFSIRDEFGLREKLKNRRKRDFKLVVKDGASTLYELFLYLPSRSYEYYEQSATVDLIATTGIGFLEDEIYSPQDIDVELKDFLADIFQALGLEFDIHFYSEWRSLDNKETFPLGYRLNEKDFARFKEGDELPSYLEVLRNFCDKFNLQLYQDGTTWTFIERRIRINPTANIPGVKLSDGAVLSRNWKTALNSDQVYEKPKADFKAGLKEFKSTFLIGDEIFLNPDLQDSKKATNEIPGWEKKLNQVFVTEDEYGILINLAKQASNSPTPYLRQTTGQALTNTPGTAVDTINLFFEVNLELDTFQETRSIQYLNVVFHAFDGTTHYLKDDLTWTDLSAALRFYDSVENGSPLLVNKELHFNPPENKTGYLEVEFLFKNLTSGETAWGSTYINSCDVSFNLDSPRKSKTTIGTTSNASAEKRSLTFGVGSIDPYGQNHVYEYLDQADNWVKASEIYHEPFAYSGLNPQSVVDRLAMMNAEEIEYSSLQTRKHYLPSELNTIEFDYKDGSTINLIPLEYKWTLGTGQVDVYAGQAIYDDTGILIEEVYGDENSETGDSVSSAGSSSSGGSSAANIGAYLAGIEAVPTAPITVQSPALNDDFIIGMKFTNKLLLNGAGELDLPQPIATTNSPTFAGITLNGNANLGGNRITNLADPVNDQDAATRKWVDDNRITDHGQLAGLSDDDHSQYVHTSLARNITAQHNFSNGLTAGNLSITGSGISNASGGVAIESFAFNGLTLSSGSVGNNIAIQDVADPVNAYDAANKNYVDSNIITDHGQLSGLGDDDHQIYMHVNVARTVNAVHNFASGFNVGGASFVDGSRNVSAANINLTGAIQSGSITSGFGDIDIGSNSLSAGAITGSSFTDAGLTNGGIVYADANGTLVNSGNATVDGSGDADFNRVGVNRSDYYYEISFLNGIRQTKALSFNHRNSSDPDFFYGLTVANPTGIGGEEGLGLWGGTETDYPNIDGSTGTVYPHIFIVRDSGNVGIGVNGIAGEKLEVNGSINISQNYKISGTTVIDSSRNFFGVNADFSGTLVVDDVATFNNNVILANQATTTSHPVRADRTLQFTTDDALSFDTETPVNLTSDRAFALSIADHGNGQRGVITTSAQSIYGAKTFDSLLTVSDDIYPEVNYTSNLGSVNKKFLTGHIAELYVELMTVSERRVTQGGRFNVGLGNILDQAISTSDTTITVRYNNLNNGDVIHLEKELQVEFMRVNSVATDNGDGTYTYDVIRNLDGSGANAWAEGDGIFNTGTTGNGFIDMYAINSLKTGVSTSGPTTAYMERTGTGYNDIDVRAVTGNMKGWYNYTTDTYGAGFGDENSDHLTIDATNGIRFLDSTGTVKAQFTSGSLSIISGSGIGNFSDAGALATSDSVDWESNVDNIPVRFADTPSGSGLFASATHFGYYSGSTWTSYIQNDGSGALASGNIAWDAAGNVTFAPSVTIGYQQVNDTPDSLSDINSTEGAKLAGIESNATVGATWGTNLSNIPTNLAALGDVPTYIESSQITQTTIQSPTIAGNQGAFSGYLAVNASSPMTIGKDVGGTGLHGIYYSGNGDHWYDNGAFQFGSATGITYTGSGNIKIQSGVDIDGANLSVNSLPRVSDQNLVARYHFENADGFDSLNNYPLTGSNLTLNDGIAGNCGYWDGDYYSGSFTDLSGEDEVTFAVSFRFVGLGGGTSGERYIYDTSFGQFALLIDAGSAPYTLRAEYNDNSVVRSTTESISMDTWYTVVVRYSKVNGTITLDLSDGNSASYSKGSGFTSTGSTSFLYMGAKRGGTDNYFRGDIDEFHIWSRRLDDNEVKSVLTTPSVNAGGVISANTVVATEGFFGDLFATNATVTDGSLTLNGANFTNMADTFYLNDSYLALGVSAASQSLTAAESTGFYTNTSGHFRAGTMDAGGNLSAGFLWDGTNAEIQSSVFNFQAGSDFWRTADNAGSLGSGIFTWNNSAVTAAGWAFTGGAIRKETGSGAIENNSSGNMSFRLRKKISSSLYTTVNVENKDAFATTSSELFNDDVFSSLELETSSENSTSCEFTDNSLFPDSFPANDNRQHQLIIKFDVANGSDPSPDPNATWIPYIRIEIDNGSGWEGYAYTPASTVADNGADVILPRREIALEGGWQQGYSINVPVSSSTVGIRIVTFRGGRQFLDSNEYYQGETKVTLIESLPMTELIHGGFQIMRSQFSYFRVGQDGLKVQSMLSEFDNSTIQLRDTVLRLIGESNINFDSLPSSPTYVQNGELYTQTATELGGSGTEKVLCVK
ncbi:beta strand repeat-containing protein [Gracilimonas tropica]|uniref:beta strand repeat-containing protein n=1 Tax=Gracilimonas tropica TaxID=454600 RepID=UPI00036799B6|nr:LamG-like jellyroll fold domain-containing protein [Gracilimonas tropica]